MRRYRKPAFASAVFAGVLSTASARAQSRSPDETGPSATPATPAPETSPAASSAPPSVTSSLSPVTPLHLPPLAAAAPVETAVARRFRLRGALRPYQLQIPVDAAVLVASAALWVPLEFMLNETVHLGRCPCDPAMLNDLDRPVAGLSVTGPVGPITNTATVVFLALPAVIDMFDVWRSGGTVPEWIEDTVVIGESLVIGGAVNEIVKLAVQRPRPAAYGIDPGSSRLGEPDLYLSFYSLSGGEVFTAAMAGAVTYAFRHPRSPWRWVYLGGAGAVATGFGLSRVLVGRHFPTDVLAAAAIGSAIGLLVPWLHQRPLPISFGAAATPGSAVITATLTTP